MMLSTQQLDVSNELCKAVSKTNNKITFVAIINQKGRIEKSQSHGSIIEKLSSTRREMFLMENALWYRMRKEYDEDLGHVRFTYAERKKRGLLSFPMGESLLLVAFKPNLDVSLLAKIIIRLINKYERKFNHFS